MNGTVTIARVVGVPIKLHWSWLVVFGLVTWTLADAVFPERLPGRSEGTYVGMAVVAAVLFFVSLLLHEVGHTVQAKRERLEIEDITLWLFGGIARFSSEFPSARAEVRIALAGPVVTLVFSAITSIVWAAPVPASVADVAVWLAVMNLALLVFNLLPALPLDGGRVLHGIVWGRTGDRRRATRVGAASGRGLGFALVATGIVLAFAGVPQSGIWLALLGWFLLRAASAEAQELVLRDVLGELLVKDLMVHRPVTARSDETLVEFLDGVAHEHRFTAYPVVDDGRAVGLIAFSRVVSQPRGDWATLRVGECMVPVSELPALTRDMPLRDALASMHAAGVDRALVIDGERLDGLLSITEIGRVISEAASKPPLPR